jgi:hypothetical protein
VAVAMPLLVCQSRCHACSSQPLATAAAPMSPLPLLHIAAPCRGVVWRGMGFSCAWLPNRDQMSYSAWAFHARSTLPRLQRGSAVAPQWRAVSAAPENQVLPAVASETDFGATSERTISESGEEEVTYEDMEEEVVGAFLAPPEPAVHARSLMRFLAGQLKCLEGGQIDRRRFLHAEAPLERIGCGCFL